jgi:transcriptional regulator with XRE-family HTH domain
VTINRRIKQVREILNLSQAKFDRSISVAVGYIAKIELGDRKVQERIIKLICVTHGVSELWLKTGVGEMFGSATANRVRDITFRTFDNLTSENQEKVLDYIDYLLDKQQKNPAKKIAAGEKE